MKYRNETAQNSEGTSCPQVDLVLLADGSSAELGPIREADRTAVLTFFDSCSEESLYTRFFTVGQGIVAHHIEHLLSGEAGTTSYVVRRGGHILGIADVERCDETTSEIAFMVADGAHGLGIATLLLERAAEDARAAGVRWFIADVLAINHPMLEVFADAGFRIERHIDHGEVSLRMSTELTETARSAARSRHAAAARSQSKRSSCRDSEGDLRPAGGGG